MLEHHIQKQILQKLVTSESARFAELKPTTIDGNIFTYHLQQLIKQHLVEKQGDGSYRLTSAGKAVGINSALDKQQLLEQAHSILLLAVRVDQKWLLRRRLAQPMYGKLGFVHTEPVLGQPIAQTAADTLLANTGLTATFSPRGSGYVRIFKDDQLESFTNFTLLEGSGVSGELIERVRNGQNEWFEKPDFTSEDMLPSMTDITQQLLSTSGHFFVELDYRL